MRRENERTLRRCGNAFAAEILKLAQERGFRRLFAWNGASSSTGHGDAVPVGGTRGKLLPRVEACPIGATSLVSATAGRGAIALVRPAPGGSGRR